MTNTWYDPAEFFVTKDHIKLVRSFVVRWEDCEFGAPAIDCKRPYGNSSVYSDMCEILGIDEDSADYDSLRKMHEETQIALDIFLKTGRMVSGRYTSPARSQEWTLVAEYVEG